jgi:altronate dehydratase large subunit
MNRTQEFDGYKRPNGEVGVRNYVLVIAAMDNSNPVARRISAVVKGTVPIFTSFGRGRQETHDRVMAGLGANPNAAAALVVSLEPHSAKRIGEQIAETGKPVEWLSIQEVGGTLKTTEEGIRIAMKMVAEASRLRREPVPMSSLMLGVECGGSDTTSGLASNPVTGQVADWVVEAGGTVILSETTEIIGGEHFLIRRAASGDVAKDLRTAVQALEDMAHQHGFQLTNLAPDNIDGGLSTMEEKSLGAIYKGGTTQIQEVVTIGQKPSKKGLVFMDAPAPGTENITSIAAGGAQIIIFSTGVGNPIGNPVTPTIKVSGNPNTVFDFRDNIDVDVSSIIKGEKSIAEVSEILYQELIEVTNGKMTCNEILADTEIAISLPRTA